MTKPERVGEYFTKNGNSYAEYKCPFCSKIWITRFSRVESGDAKSCGCVRLGKRTHGKSNTKEYIVHQGMMSRCYTESHIYYDNYGGRGIEVCERWWNVNNFISDMGNIPEGMQLGRIDNNGPYCKENCRWETREENLRNKRNTIYLTNNEGVTKTMIEWSEIMNIPYLTMYMRYDRGWSHQDIIYGKGN